MKVPAQWQWFDDARFGLFVHFGPYADYGRGEQVLLREWIDHREYAERACRWNPTHADPESWARAASDAGMKYAVLTTRHHDGYCLWDSAYTDYTSVAQAPRRDLVREFVDACRKHGLRVGLYYSWADFRIPAFFAGPENDPVGWREFCDYCHNQVLELLTNYGAIDVFWFDGEWPHSPEVWRSAELVRKMRELQPGILINNRLGMRPRGNSPANAEGLGGAIELGDFGTPEHHITADPHRLWESCQVSTWRLWGWATGERWRPADLLLDMLVESASKGGNLLLNVGPKPDGSFPAEFLERLSLIGDWMRLHGEAIYGTDRGELFDFTTFGRVTRKQNRLYLIFRFWDGEGRCRFPFLKSRIARATLLTTGQQIRVEQDDEFTTLLDLPRKSPTALFPVIRLDLDGPAEATELGKVAQWTGDPNRYLNWARSRGTKVFADGKQDSRGNR